MATKNLVQSVLNGRTNFASLKAWVITWKALPVLSWIRAAEMYRIGRYREAIEQYKKGLVKHPNHPARHCATMDLARCLFANGEVVEAEQYFRQLVVQLPHSKRVHTALFTLQLRTGLSLDAAWTMRRACKHIVPDEHVVGLYLYCLVENGGPSFLLNEVLQRAQFIEDSGKMTLLIRAAKLRLALDSKGYAPRQLKKLELFADEEEACLEVILLAAEALLRAGKVASSRRLLRKGLRLDPAHPRVLSLFAETYLRAGPFYNPEFGVQMAKEGCRRSSWRSPREMHVLAEAFFHLDDPLSALATAERARQEGSRLMGTYRDSTALEQLISTLREDIEKHTVDAQQDKPVEGTGIDE